MKFRITRIALYAYHRRGTLSFGWRYRMQWWPEWYHDSFGWFFGFWRFGIELLVHDKNDPWGERHAEEMAEVWNMVVNEMEGDE